MRLLTGFIIVFLAACSGQGEKTKGNGNEIVDELKIACAANMQYAMDSIAVIFEKNHHIKVEITSGSSGMLTAQIENGAPYDVFVSANMTYPNSLHDKHLGDTPKIYGKGRLVLAMDAESNFKSIEEVLFSEEIKRLAIADAATAPYGMAAEQYLKNIDVFTKIQDKLVVGESIGQVNQYLTTDAVDAGFTSYSFKVKNEEEYRYFEVNSTLFNPINQGVILLKNGKENSPEASNKFVNFLCESDTCKAILHHFGYLTN